MGNSREVKTLSKNVKKYVISIKKLGKISKMGSVKYTEEQVKTLRIMANHEPDQHMLNFGGENIVNFLFEQFNSPFKFAIGTIPIVETDSSFYYKTTSDGKFIEEQHPRVIMREISLAKSNGILFSVVNDPIKEHYILEVNYKIIDAFKNG